MNCRALFLILLTSVFISNPTHAGRFKNPFVNVNKDVIGTWRCTKGCVPGWSKIIIFHKNEWFERGKIKGYYYYSSDDELSMGTLVVKVPFETAADFFLGWEKKDFGVVWSNGSEEEFVKIK